MMPSKLPASITITEVGPRDGLQNEAARIPTEAKIRLVNLLSHSGVREIEVSSFVSPKWVPQLGDASEVFAAIERQADVTYSALVPNERGMDQALAAGVNKIAVFTAASESFAQRNTNATIAETLDRFRPIIATAHAHQLPVRAYVSCVVACPFEGPIQPAFVRRVVQKLLELGADEIDLGETIGVAVPSDIDELYAGLDGVLAASDSTLHLHDTRGTALACAYRAMQLGVRRFDASCGGLGGCPYAPGAAGNLATEDLVYLCNGLKIKTGITLDAMFAASRHLRSVLGRPLTGRVFNADGQATASCASLPVTDTTSTAIGD